MNLLARQVSVGIIFIEGMLTFLSPCVLPLIPMYLTYLAGSSIENFHSKKQKYVLYTNALAFILGFFIIFVLLGAAATTIGKFFLSYTHKRWVEIISGLILILFGLHHAKVILIKSLYREKRFSYEKKIPTFVSSILMGMAFSFGWTPCVGPALGSVMALAATEATLQKGILFLSVYSIGLGIPFFLCAIFADTILKKLTKVYPYFNLISKIAGWLFIFLGTMMILGFFKNFIRI